MNWLIKLLGGYTREDIKNCDKDYQKIIGEYLENIEFIKRESDRKYKLMESELKSMIDKEKKKSNRLYQQNYRARKYLKTIKVNNNWKKHWDKIVEILDNN